MRGTLAYGRCRWGCRRTKAGVGAAAVHTAIAGEMMSTAYRVFYGIDEGFRRRWLSWPVDTLWLVWERAKIRKIGGNQGGSWPERPGGFPQSGRKTEPYGSQPVQPWLSSPYDVMVSPGEDMAWCV